MRWRGPVVTAPWMGPPSALSPPCGKAPVDPSGPWRHGPSQPVRIPSASAVFVPPFSSRHGVGSCERSIRAQREAGFDVAPSMLISRQASRAAEGRRTARLDENIKDVCRV